jgi:hypothetical protein
LTDKEREDVEWLYRTLFALPSGLGDEEPVGGQGRRRGGEGEEKGRRRGGQLMAAPTAKARTWFWKQALPSSSRYSRNRPPPSMPA